MRKTYRAEDTKTYWGKRWSRIPADAAMTNASVYPLRHATAAVAASPGRILEAGCGAGRILRHFHQKGCDIHGIDYIPEAVEKLRLADPTLSVSVGDVTALGFPDASFDCVLAFGLYHNFDGPAVMDALRETARCMKPGAVLCASFRADNLCNAVNDWLVRRRQGGGHGPRAFHKLNLTEGEFRLILELAGFAVERMEYVENMSLLYKFPLWRAAADGRMHEDKDRSAGYALNAPGRFIQDGLMRFFPSRFCNVYVATARKAGDRP